MWRAVEQFDGGRDTRTVLSISATAHPPWPPNPASSPVEKDAWRINAKTEQRTHAPPDGLKRGWVGARLPPIPDHQARALDPVDPGGGGRQVNGLAGLHPHQVVRVLDHEEHVVGVCRQDQPQLRLPKHQPRQPPAEETEEGLDRQRIQLTREGAPLPYSLPEADRLGQGPVEPDQTLRVSVQHLEKAHKLGPKAERPQGDQEIPVIHPIECLLLVQGQEGERQTISTPQLQEVPDQIQVVKDGPARDGVDLVGMDYVRQHGPQPQQDGLCYDLVVRAEERDGTPIL
ncbi:unnamed protein product [Caretta caretta]